MNRFEYYLTDHLGDTRIVYTDLGANGSVDKIQEDSYYAFGLKMPGFSQLKSGYSGTKELFNGKELQNDIANFGFYDFGARFYDPALGRWHSPDPMASEYSQWTPYVSFVDNPIYYIDPNGKWVIGAGFWRNIFESDDKITAENMFYSGEAIGFYKNNGDWYVSTIKDVYIEGSDDFASVTTELVKCPTNHTMLDAFGVWSQGIVTKTRGNANTEGTWVDKNIGEPVGNIIFDFKPLSSIPTFIDGWKTLITGSTLDGYELNSMSNRLLYGKTSVVLSVAGNATGTNTFQDEIIENLFFDFMTNTVTNTATEIDKNEN